MSGWVFTVAAVLLLPLAALAVPLEIRIRLLKRRCRAAQVDLRLAWLFGLLRFRAFARDPALEGASKGTPSRTNSRRPKAGRVLAFLSSPGVVAVLLSLLKGLLRACRFRQLRGSLRLGFADPCSTGRLAGLWWSARWLLPSPPKADLTFETDFSGEVAEGFCDAELRISPLRSLRAVLLAAVSPALWRATAAALRS